MNRSHLLVPLALASITFAAAPCCAQTSFSATQKHAWGPYTGWIDFSIAGTPAGSEGAALVPRVNPVIMKGFVWSEHIGWINLGDGSPEKGQQYSNADGTDFGVNVALDGELSGFAWSANKGWINFSGGALATPAQPARYSIESPRNRLRGFVWGENIGWINLDDDEHFVEALCVADFDGNGTVNSTDVSAFINAWFTDLANGTLLTDYDHNGVVNSTDVSTFINLWFADLAACL